MEPHLVEELREAFAQYQAATAEAQRHRAPGPEHEVVTEQLRAARVQLCRILELTGWTPPADVASQVRADQQLLRRPVVLPAAS